MVVLSLWTCGRVSGDWVVRAGWLRAHAPNGLQAILLSPTPGCQCASGCCPTVPVLPTDPMELMLFVRPFPSGTPRGVSEGRTVAAVFHESVALASALRAHGDPLLSRMRFMRWSRGTRHVRPRSNSDFPDDVRARFGRTRASCPVIPCGARHHEGMLPG